MLRRLNSSFSLRARIVFGALLLIGISWAFTQFVLAEKEANVYIFPSALMSDGWESDEASLMQDLSPDAELADFTHENSAQVFYGTRASTSTLAATSTNGLSENVLPAVSIDTSLVPAFTPEVIPEEVSPVATSTPIISSQFPDSFVPSGLNIETPTLLPIPSMEQIASSSIQSRLDRAMFEFLSRVSDPRSALALEVPTSTIAEVNDASAPLPITDKFISSGIGSLSVPPLASGRTDGDGATSSLEVIDLNSASGTDVATSGTETPKITNIPTVESADPYTVALCTTLGKTCHVMEYDGFGLGGALDKNPLLGATLELSLAGRGAFTSGEYDRVLVRAYHAGHWQFLGATELRGDISNGNRGSYLKYELSDIGDWEDLTDLKVVVEYDRTSDADASAYVDGIWINARYANDAIVDASPEEVALSGMNVRSALAAKDAEARKARRDQLTLPDGEALAFVNAQEYEGAILSVKTDKNIYDALGEGRTYVNVTNESPDPQVVRLQFHFPTEGASVRALSRFVHNVPYKVGQLRYDDVGYFCDTGWTVGTSSTAFHCATSDEVRSCDRLNDDRTNCITAGARVGLTEGTEYRDGWEDEALLPGAISDTEGLFAKAIDLLLNQLPPDIIPSVIAPIANLADSVVIQPGATAYFRADIAVPLNGRGDFFVEAAAQSGAYGLVRAEWDGSWNYRTHISIDNSNVTATGTFAVPISLDDASPDFWKHIASDGSDIRFVDEESGTELPYWVSRFDSTTRSGSAWVRVNEKGLGTSTTIAMYYGYATTTSRSDPAAPFRSALPAPRGLIFGGSQSDMTLHVIALDDHVRVSVPGKPEVVLKYGESALFDGMKPGTVVSADGPITASIEAPGANATFVPTGYLGDDFVIPGIGGERELALGTTGGEVTHAELDLPDGPAILDPVEGSIVMRGVTLSDSISLTGTQGMIAVLGTNAQSLSASLYPATMEDLYGFQVGKSVIGIGDDATALTIACGNEARQNIDGRRAGSSVNLNHCAAGGGLLADAVRVMDASTAIGLVDVSRDDLTSALPETEFASAYISPSDAVGVAVLCAPGAEAFAVGVFNSQGGLMASSTCAARGAYPGKTFITPEQGVFAAGSFVRSLSRDISRTFLAAIVPSMKASTDGSGHYGLIPLISPQMTRTPGALHPNISMGGEEFVIPGEHRKLDVDVDGREKDHVDTLLSKDREFSIRQMPSFTFKYKRQANSLLQGVRDVFGVKPFTVSRVVLKHVVAGDIPVDYDISYGDNNEWSVSLRDAHGNVRPGKYTLHVEIEEGGESYVDEYDFYWGVLAINFNKSMFTPGENAVISIGALSNNGNTICDAQLKMWVTDTVGAESEVSVTPSGLCDGNNVIDVPDYAATYLPAATGTYRVKLVRFDQDQNIASQVSDSFEVRATVPYSIERVGPTRIYPIAHYPMKIRVQANEAFEGNIVERVPGDFVFIDRGNANLEWGDVEHSFLTATWAVKLPAGGSIDLQYIFDAPDRSPDLYLLGPLEMQSTNGGADLTELRAWQIASDAAGKMMLFYDSAGALPPGWLCVSCATIDPFFEKLVVGSSSYNGLGGGTATHTPTAIAVVNLTTSTGVGENSTASTLNAPIGHTHSLTPTIAPSSNYPLYRDLRVIKSISAGDPGTIPAGAIGMFDVASSSLPTGWYRYAPLDGRYIRSQSSVTSSGGANTHGHAVTGTTSAPPQSGLRLRTGVTNGATDVAHTHTLTATSTDVVNNEPPYTEVLFARMSVASSTPNYLIGMWDDTPPAGWVNVSDAGGALAGQFLKGSTTYGSTGGGTSHIHANINGAVTGVANNLNDYRSNTANAQARAAHMHTVDISGFSDDSQLPPYVDVIFAKSLSGISVYAQDSFRFYDNTNAITPTDPWPQGASDYDENIEINTPGESISANTRLRIRMSLAITNATTSTSSVAFKLQYVAADDCPSALNWTDVAAMSATGVPWRGYNNTSVTHNATLPSYLLTSSTVAESYVEENNSAVNPNLIAQDGFAEWDWVVEQLQATSSTLYCFRMVETDGTPLDAYTNYPQILTNAAPNIPIEAAPFSYEKIGTTTPSIQFSSADTESNDIDYQIQISYSATFTSSVIDADSINNPELFSNITDPTNKAPFTSANIIEFKPVSGTLQNGATYWLRIRAKDTNNSNTWSDWNSAQSFTVDTAVTISTWHQTTRDQFQAATTFNGSNANATDSIVVNVGSTTATAYSDAIDFALHTTGTVWGSLTWNDREPSGSLLYQIEYSSPSSGWILVPDTSLPGNSAGFSNSGVSLLSIDPVDYPILRIKANFSVATQVVNEWSISWGYKVDTPTLYVSFDNQKIATRTPYFEFMAIDPQSDDLLYEIQWSTTANFAASTTRNSGAHAGFQDLTIPADLSPFTSGSRIRFTIQGLDQLASSTTYFWRVRAVDPGGAGIYSFWSDVRSLTVDTTVQVSTWFQTANDQFLADTLSSMRSYANGSSTVATTTDEVMLAYGEGIIQTPRYRIFDGTTLRSERSALSVGAAINWVVLKASALGNQYILGTLGTDHDVNYQVYDSGSWGNLMELGVNAPSLQRRSFDVAFETLSGRALAVDCDSSPDATYRIWDGGAWVTTGTINLSFTSNCEWVRMASSPKTNEIIAVFRNTGSQYQAQVWNATTSTWGNAVTQGSMTEIAHEGMAVEYEESANQAMVVTSNGNNSNFTWRTWNGTAWSGTTNTTIGDDFEWGNLRRNVGNDQMVLCYVDQDNDVGVVRWSGAAWVAYVEQTTIGTGKEGRPTDCIFETKTGRASYIIDAYSQTGGTFYRFWNTAAWGAQTALGVLPTTFTDQLTRTSASGTILGMFFDHVGTDYEYAEWSGTSWMNAQTIETSASVVTTPYGEPFYMAARYPATSGTIVGTPIDFDDGVSPAWSSILWDVTKPGGSTFTVQVEYQDQTTGVWALIPDSEIAGNATGIASSPISILSLNSDIYNVIRLKGTAECVAGACPFLNDWTVKWAAGVRISGIARQHDLTTNITSGTVAVAVNGAVQTGKTGVIDASGNWFIDNVTIFSGGLLTIFIDGAPDTNEAVSVARYTGPGDSGGMRLAERWLSIGSASTTGQTVTLQDIGRYDNSVSADEDIFFDVGAGGDYSNCVTGVCLDSSIDVYANTFRPSTSTPQTVNTWDMRTDAYFYGDANTVKVSGSWKNAGGFTSDTSTIIFNGTSGARTIDSTGAATSTFYNVTFGESGSAATWSLSSPFTAVGTVAMSFGTTSQGAHDITLEGNLTIGASALFVKGAATTTFSGALGRTWIDSSSGQDLGTVVVDGTVKTITLGSNVKATDVTIGANDTINAGGANTLTVLGNWNNLGTFTAQTGTVAFAATSPGKTINQGVSNFYNTTFNGAGGTWIWQNTNATTTNDLTISALGTTTLPSGTLAVGGSFNTTAGAFLNNSGVVRLTSTASGKTVRANGSSWNDLVFAGSGGTWNMSDTNATVTQDILITAGTPTLPAGTLTVGRDFINQSGAFSANSGTLKMTSAGAGKTIKLLSSSLANLLIAGAGGFTIVDTNATSTGDVTFTSGSTTLPTGTFAIGGSFANSSLFTASGGLVTFTAASGVKTIDPGTSFFYDAKVNGAGTFTVSGNATTTHDLILKTAGGFTLSSGKTLAVGGTFTNQVSGAATTWTGSNLSLYSGAGYSLNTKTAGGDTYGTLSVAANTHIRMWGSSATTYAIDAIGSLYSQDHNAVPGELDIWGAYTRNASTEYWDHAIDFDGAALGGLARQVNVKFASGATATFATGTTLEMIGSPTASTTVDRQSSGSYGITLNSTTLNAAYYQMRNMNAAGLSLAGSTIISALSFGDIEVAQAGGSAMTIASTTVDQNAGMQIFNMRFATTTAIAAYNVTESGSPLASSFIRFKQHYGNIAGERFDNDPAGDPGYIRWDDSMFVISISGTVYSDAGVTPMGAPTCNDVTQNVRVKVDGLGNFAAACSSANGTFTVPGVTFTGDTVMTVYLDTNGGRRAVYVTKSAAADLSGIKLYQDRVIVSHEDVTPMNILGMNAYDGGNDTDIPFVATLGAPNTLTVSPETEFWIWTGKTFVPDGNITLNSGGSGNNWDGSFHIDNNAVFTAQGAESHSVGGKWTADSGTTFTAASSTFTFTATTSGKAITAIAPITFWNTTFNGAGGNWSVNQTMNVGNNFVVTAGTVSGASPITVSGANASGNGSVALTGGTFTLLNGGTFGGTSDWSFGNLTLGTGGVGTTTKTASSTVNVSGILTVASNHTLLAGTPSTWNLTGGGTPFVQSGTFDAQTSTFRYSGVTATNITPAPYYRLYLAPSAAGGPTYTLLSGTFTVNNDFMLGDGVNTATVTAATNDPVLNMLGDVFIRATTTFIASDLAALNASRDWVNAGIFTHSGGTVNFVATTTGHLVTTASSTFYNVNFNSASGGWTITGNATATNNFSLTELSQFTMASGTTLEVRGVFTNAVGGSATTWTGATLYMNGSAPSGLNSKSQGGERYDTLNIGANTAINMWNSVATTTLIHSTGSLYSQNHAAATGSLYIYGAYTRSSGTDYWSYANDFDGTELGGGSRQVDVRFASATTMTVSGTGGLEIIGAGAASTTLDVQSAGTYAMNISGGSTTMRYLHVRGINGNGLNFTGTPTVNAIDDADLLLQVAGGSMITVAGGTIDANPLKIFSRNYFSTSTGVLSGYNVKATGITASIWRFAGTPADLGNYAGESHDSDPGGDPGYIVWDDSANSITISGNVYSDEGNTPIGGPTCNGVTQSVRLKVQGAGSYASACNAVTGAFSISTVVFNPGDTLTLYLDTNSTTSAANISYDPTTNISNMHLYRNRVILRHEQGGPLTINAMDIYDGNQDTDIPFTASLGAPNTLLVRANTKLIVWTGKTFAPNGNVTIHGNAGGAIDGSVELYATSTWSSTGTETATLAGQFLARSGASVAPANSTFIFNATTTGKFIAASSSLTFYDLTFSGAAGGWNISGVATTSNNISITAGNVILPSWLMAVGGSFDANGGTFAHNSGSLRFTATASGKNIRASGSSFNALEFRGMGGGWTFLDTNATATAGILITSGTAVLPTGTLAVGTDFDNEGGIFTSSNGTLKMTATSTGRIVRTNGSALGGFLVGNNGDFTFLDANATATGDVIFASGSTTLPFANFVAGGNFIAIGTISVGTGTATFNPSSGTKNVALGASSLYNVNVLGTGGATVSFGANATATNAFTLTSGNFTQASGSSLAVGGIFTNLVGGGATAWTGSTLSLYSGTSYSMNTKTQGGDVYGTLRLAANNNIRSWNSSATTYQIPANASLYSQNHGAVSGALNIYGAYARVSGTDYWSYATNFDGVALGGSARQVNVRFGAGATAVFSTNSSLQMVGVAAASTTVDRIASGSYGLTVSDATLNANYYQFRNLDATGLNLTGTTTITGMNNGDFELATNGGSMITIASSTIDQNASAQYSQVRFATTTAIGGANVSRIGTTTNAITWTYEHGNMASEKYDNDGIDACGSIRWSDSSCLFSDQKTYRWRNDDGGEGALATEWYSQSWSKRQRVRITNNSASTVTNAQVKMNVPYDADMQSNFNDLRFTDSGGTTSIPYWVETYVTSGSSTVWVKVPTLTGSAVTDIFMYYGNASVAAGSSGTSTFKFFDDFEDNNLSEYSGDVSLFANSASIYHEGNYGLSASAGNTTAQNTSGIGQVGAGVGRDTTFRFFQQINITADNSDEPCFMFAIQSPITAHQNYAVCLEAAGADKVAIAKNVAYNSHSGSASEIGTTSVTWPNGLHWYETSIDWLSNNQINVTVYDDTGAVFATTSAVDSTYTSGGVGFTFWYQHSGWDTPAARQYISSAPGVDFGLEQADSGATWKAAENTVLVNQLAGENIRLRMTVRNSGLPLTNKQFRLQVAEKLSSPNCESVPTGNYIDVTPNGSCGTSPACMAASTQFTDKASTTQLLSIPALHTFVNGEIMKDASIQTNPMALPALSFTEVEYNFQMVTAYAVQNAYCFRATDAGTPLDNYSRVAEMTVLHPPVIADLTFNGNSNIALTEGTTTTISATATLSDLNGYADIIAASSTFYRSSVAGGGSCTADLNNCYQIGTSSCSLYGCSGNSCEVSCSAPMKYFADPTDAGSYFNADNWQAILSVWDTSSSYDTMSASQEVLTLQAMSASSTISFGSVVVGADTGASDATTTVNNTGNTVLNLGIGGDPMTAGASSISYSQQKYSTSTFTYSACTTCNILSASSSPTYFPVAITKPTSTSAFFRDIYWGLAVPLGTAASTHSGTNYFFAQ